MESHSVIEGQTKTSTKSQLGTMINFPVFNKEDTQLLNLGHGTKLES